MWTPDLRTVIEDFRAVIEEHPAHWVVASEAVEGAFAYPSADDPCGEWALIVEKDA